MGICGQNASHRLSGLRDFTDAPSFALTACFARGVPPNEDGGRKDELSQSHRTPRHSECPVPKSLHFFLQSPTGQAM